MLCNPLYLKDTGPVREIRSNAGSQWRNTVRQMNVYEKATSKYVVYITLLWACWSVADCYHLWWLVSGLHAWSSWFGMSATQKVQLCFSHHHHQQQHRIAHLLPDWPWRRPGDRSQTTTAKPYCVVQVSMVSNCAWVPSDHESGVRIKPLPFDIITLTLDAARCALCPCMWQA